MTDIKAQHLLTLVHLLSLGARHNFVRVSTADLGKAIQKSQQSASKHLADLEHDGLLERMTRGNGTSVRITDAGYRDLLRLGRILNTGLGLPEASTGSSSSSSQIVLKGRLVSGMGEGAYYMSLKGYTRQFKIRIGHIPFPGTLNVKLDGEAYVEAVRRLDTMDGARIDGFCDGKRTYGWVTCFVAKINGLVDAHLVRLERTHHDPSVIELISKHNIRESAGISDGSEVVIRVRV